MQLKHTYDLYYASGVDSRRNMTQADYESQLQPVISFDTAELFWQLFLHLKLPSQFTLRSKIYVFKAGVRPLWEAAANQAGGRLYFKLPLREETEECWQGLLLELISDFGGHEHLDELVNGVEMTVRTANQLSLALWVNTADTRAVGELFAYLKAAVPFGDARPFDFVPHPRRHLDLKG